MSTTAVATPDHDSSPSSDAVSDVELGGDILFGIVVGTPILYLALLSMCLVAGIGLANAALVSILPCVLSGVFFGGVIPLSRQMASHEAAERVARSTVASIRIPVDVVEVRPAA